MRGSVWALRQAMGMRGRKRKPDPIISALHSDSFGSFRRSQAHADDVALKGVVPIFLDPPGALRGAPPGAEISVGFSLYADAQKVAAGNLPGTVIGFQPASYARMLAKIAHAKATAHLGLGGFVPFLPPIILQEFSDWPRYVGGANTDPLPPQPEAGHWIDLHWLKPPLEYLLIGRIRLFPEIEGPLYDVLIGQRQEAH